MKVKEGLKQLSITLPEDLYTEIKHLSIDFKVTTKDFCIKALRNYINDIQIENVSYDELSATEKNIIDIAREDYKKGKCVDIDSFLEETE
jgi:hypothetical protein